MSCQSVLEEYEARPKKGIEKTVRFEARNPQDENEMTERRTAKVFPHISETNGFAKPDFGVEDSEQTQEKNISVGRPIRKTMSVKNSIRPGRTRRLSLWKSSEHVDPFLQKFSTRDHRKFAPAKKITRAMHRRSTNTHGEGVSTMREVEKDESSTASSIYDTSSVYGEDENCWTQCTSDKPMIFDPNGSFINVWFYFVVFAVRYNLWVLVLRCAFPDAQGEFSVAWFVFDYFCDIIYLLDIAVCIRTGFLEEGILVEFKKRVAKRYLTSPEFAADVLSILPTDIFFFVIGVKPILRLNRLIKAYKSFRMKAVMESQTNYPTFVRVFFLMHLMFLMIHWNAAMYYLISGWEGFGSNEWVYKGNGSLYDQYFHSLYWSTLTLTAIGDLETPRTLTEFIYTILCYLAGVFLFATIVGNAGSIIVNRNAGRLDFEKQRESTKQYMKHHNVPKDLQRRVLMWYDYSWARGRMSIGGDLNSLHMLPNKMKTEIALYVNLETLRKVTFLQKCQPEFLHGLVLNMTLRIFTPGDLVCKKNEVAREMYVIIDGKVEVVGDQGQVLKVLSGGDFFGEIGILNLSEGQNRRTADVRTVGYVECIVLSKEAVMAATKDYPEAQAVLAEYGRRRLSRHCVAKDPRLVDMDDVNKNQSEDNNINVEKISSKLQDSNSKLENLKNNDVNGSYERSTPLLTPPSPMYETSPPNSFSFSYRPMSARVQLQPISSEIKFVQKPRRASMNGPIISPITSPEQRGFSSLSWTREISRRSEDDEPLVKEFVSSCTEAFQSLKKSLYKKADKEFSKLQEKLRTLEDKIKSKENRIKWYEDRACTLEKELKLSKSRVREMEYFVQEREKRIQELEEELKGELSPNKEGKKRQRKKSLTSCSTTSLLPEDHDSK